MDDLATIGERLGAALDRIETGLAALERDDRDTDEKEALRSALEAERAKSAQLTERVRAIRETQEQTVAQLERRVVRLQERAAEQDAELQRLKAANASLRAAAEALRTAVATEASIDAAVLNRALEAELEATRAAQAADRGELDAILAELTPLIGERADV